MCIKIKVLPAANGDSILISLGSKDEKKFNILIDGGRGRVCHRKLVKELEQIKDMDERIDLLVVTHIDDDHISGILKLFRKGYLDESTIKHCWFNSGELISRELAGVSDITRELPLEPDEKEVSYTQGWTLENKLKELKCWHDKLIVNNMEFEFGEIKMTILSPDIPTLERLQKKWEIEVEKNKKVSATIEESRSFDEVFNANFKEDTSLPNRSSIAFLLCYKGKKLLMLGDAHPTVIYESLTKLGYSESNKLSVDIMKVPHHGSKGNINRELLSIINCSRFIISTDGSRHGHPDKECLARIIQNNDCPVTFYFNYQNMDEKFTEEERKKIQFQSISLTERDNYTVPWGDSGQ
ncbi:ComEC/Rec2 family competence protein [Bacillus cereus]